MGKAGLVLACFAVLFVVSAAIYTMEEKGLAHTLTTLSWGVLLLGIIVSMFESHKETGKTG